MEVGWRRGRCHIRKSHLRQQLRVGKPSRRQVVLIRRLAHLVSSVIVSSAVVSSAVVSSACSEAVRVADDQRRSSGPLKIGLLTYSQ